MTGPKPNAEEVAERIVNQCDSVQDVGLDDEQLQGFIASELRSRDAALEAAEGKIEELERAKYGTPCKCEAWMETAREAEAERDALAARMEEAVGLLERWYADESPYLDTRVFLARSEIAGEEAGGMSPRPE